MKVFITIIILAHVTLLLSLLIQAQVLSPSPWLKNKLDDDNDGDDDNNPFAKRRYCSGNQLFCRKDVDGPEGRKGKIMRCCKHRCVDTDTDVDHCGFCGKICPFPKQCCKGLCVDTNSCRFNCGECGNRCRFLVRCEYGMCGYGQPDVPPWPPKSRWKPPPPDDPRRS